MPKTIAQLRKSKQVGLPEFTMPMCVSQKTLARIQSLESEIAELDVEVRARQRREADGEGPPRRASEGGPDPEAEAKRTELEGLYDVMREHTGELLVRGLDEGAWDQFKVDNPPDVDNPQDNVHCRGWVSFAGLKAGLARFAQEWNGEPLDDDDWEWLRSVAAPGDLAQLCQRIVAAHEGPGVVPKSRRASSGNRRSSTD